MAVSVSWAVLTASFGLEHKKAPGAGPELSKRKVRLTYLAGAAATAGGGILVRELSAARRAIISVVR